MVSWFTVLLMTLPVRSYAMNHSVPELENRIYRGIEVGIDQYSYATFLLFQATSPSSCGGSLILVQAVLTAAHCVDELRYKRGQIHTYHGSSTPVKAKATRKVVDYRVNPKYNEQTGKNNLAVVFLDNRLPLQHLIKKIPLCTADPGPGAILYSVGWGKQKVGDRYVLPDFSSWRPLKATKQIVLSRSDCIKYAGFKVSPPFLCSGPDIGEFYKDDAGNGLVIKTPTLMLVSVLSFVANGVSVSTSVEAHRNWIKDSCHSMYMNYCVKKG